MADLKGSTLRRHIDQHVEPGATVYTDTLPSYKGLARDFAHETIDHAERYVDGKVHTNGLENFWSLLKRGLHGTYEFRETLLQFWLCPMPVRKLGKSKLSAASE